MSTAKQSALASAALISAALIAAPGAAKAAYQQVVWEGYATNVGATAACAGVGGTGKGATYVSIYRPKILPTDTASYLSFMYLRAGITFLNTSETTVHQMHGSGTYTGIAINSRAKGFGYSGGSYSLAIAPAVVSASTEVVEIKGTINNYFNVTGCDLNFVGIYVKRID